LRGIRPILEGLIETFEHPARVGPLRLRRNIGEASEMPFRCGGEASEMSFRCGGARNGVLDRIHHALYVVTVCDPALRLTAAVFPDFAARSGYPSIAALSLNLGIDVMRHEQT
jgi:hypothetical protein